MIDIKKINEMVLQNLPNRGGDPDRKNILLTNELMRRGYCGGLPEDLGYVALNIPVPDMRVLQILFPDLASFDSEIQHKAWLKFLTDPRSEPYKIRKNDGKRGLRNSHKIISR